MNTRFFDIWNQPTCENDCFSNVRNFEAAAFAALPEEVRLRLLMRAINAVGHEGPAELGKVENLLTELDDRMAQAAKIGPPRIKQTLAGALISLAGGRILIAPAPARRRRSGP